MVIKRPKLPQWSSRFPVSHSVRKTRKALQKNASTFCHICSQLVRKRPHSVPFVARVSPVPAQILAQHRPPRATVPACPDDAKFRSSQSVSRTSLITHSRQLQMPGP